MQLAPPLAGGDSRGRQHWARCCPGGWAFACISLLGTASPSPMRGLENSRTLPSELQQVSAHLSPREPAYGAETVREARTWTV